MALALIQPSFAAGELSPNMYARVDLAKFHVGAATMRNFFVDYRGGASSRPGSRFVGSSYSPYAANPGSLSTVRLVPFQFSDTQTYVLEFGTNLIGNYMRIISNGGYVVEASKTISALTNASPGVFTSNGHGYSNGQWVTIPTMVGTSGLLGKTFIVQNVTTNTFTLTDLFGNAVNTILSGAFSSGTAARIYTVVSPYAATDLINIKWTQSADVLTITHPSYPIYNLTRSGNTSWAFTAVTYAAQQAAPVAVSAVASDSSGTTAQFSYVVTAINAITGEESIASNIVTCASVDISQTAGSITITWNAVTGAGSYNVYKAPAGYDTSFTPVGALYGYIGTTVGLQLTDGNITADFTQTPPQALNPFAPSAVIQVNMTANGSGYTQSTTTATITTSTGSGAILLPVVIGGEVQAVLILNAGHGYAPADTISIADSNVSPGTGATATLTLGPSSGTYPGATAYFQQRQYFANSSNNPVTFWASKVGLFQNMDAANPVQANDAITDSLAAQQVNGIQFMVPMPSGLVLLTGLGAWQLTGGANSTAVTPQDADATPQAYNGCHPNIPPIPINYDILYIQSRGSIVRDLSYNFFTNIYTGTDLTTISNHLFTGHQIVDWTWSEEPYKIVWAVRDDGTMLSLTYLKEQDVIAWARHDTFGLYEAIASVSEFQTINGQLVGLNAVYYVVQRNVQNVWVQYIERQDSRIWQTVENTWAVDAGLQTPSVMPNANLTASAASGNGVTFTADASVFNSGMVGSVIRMGYGLATITSYISATQVVANITIPITITMPNTPIPGTGSWSTTPLPVPASSGQWSVNAMVTAVSGLDHLNGCTVAILADGSIQPSQIVSGGAVTLQNAASLVTVGLPFQAQLASLDTDIGKQVDTIQGKRKSVPALTVRVYNARGLKMGQNSFKDVVEFKERGNSVFLGLPIPLYTGDQRIILKPAITKSGQVFIQQDYPLPATVLGIIPEILIGDNTGGATT